MDDRSLHRAHLQAPMLLSSLLLLWKGGSIVKASRPEMILSLHRPGPWEAVPHPCFLSSKADEVPAKPKAQTFSGLARSSQYQDVRSAENFQELQEGSGPWT